MIYLLISNLIIYLLIDWFTHSLTHYVEMEEETIAVKS